MPARRSLGAWLRSQREARGVSLRDIADSSKISLRYLEALESDRMDVLPAPVFAKGFLREYARVVGLDPDEAVNLYLLARSESEPEPSLEEPVATTRRSAAPSTLGYGLLLALAVVLFVGLAALLSYYAKHHREANRPAPSPELVATFAAPVRAQPTEIAAPVDLAPAPTAEPTAAAEVAQGPLEISLEFSDDCWVELVVDGTRRASELRAGGETLQVEAESYVLLTLGNAAAVRVEVDGRPFALPTGASKVVRDLRIERPGPAAANGAG
ncbi:MAG: helix-turn-helix domain-containing protein [Acidobacteria bacterium]|nr:helix-turn-helix domain-containing protein [Acidobacteriota bacterium]